MFFSMLCIFYCASSYWQSHSNEMDYTPDTNVNMSDETEETAQLLQDSRDDSTRTSGRQNDNINNNNPHEPNFTIKLCDECEAKNSLSLKNNNGEHYVHNKTSKQLNTKLKTRSKCDIIRSSLLLILVILVVIIILFTTPLIIHIIISAYRRAFCPRYRNR